MRGTSNRCSSHAFFFYLHSHRGIGENKNTNMKKNYLNLFLSAVALLCCMVASAHDFEVDGIFYNITDESAKTVEVTFKGNKFKLNNNKLCIIVFTPFRKLLCF